MIIKKVLGQQQIFVFGELLDAPGVKELANTPHKSWLELLRLFAYGTYADYKAQPDLPKLSTPQSTKLKLLSIVEYAARNKELSYGMLMRELDVNNVRELEDLIIDCVYQGLIQGKLDQRKQMFEVQSVMGRDLGPHDVDNMINTLGNWLNTTDNFIKHIDKRIESANATHEKKKKEQADIDKSKKDTIEAIKIELQNNNQEAIALVMGEGMRMERAPRGGPMDDDRRGNRRRQGAPGPAQVSGPLRSEAGSMPLREPASAKKIFAPNRTR